MRISFFLISLLCFLSKTLYGQVVIHSTGGSNAYVLSYPANLTELTAGLSFTFKANHTNTGASTLQINSFTAHSIKKQVGQDLEANEIRSGQVITVVYDGTNFQMLSQSGLATPTPLWKDNGTVTYLIDATDSVGIGVSQPVAKLDVSGNASIGTDNVMGVSTYGFIYGKDNTLNGDLSFISGASNKVDGSSSFVVGDNNKVIDNHVFMMGTNNNGDINNVFLFGNYLTAEHEAAFMLGDHSTTTALSSTAENQFSSRFDGGYRFFTSSDLASAKSVYINNGGNVGIGVVAPINKMELYHQGQATVMRIHRDEDKDAALEFYNATAGDDANTDWRLIGKADGGLYIQYDQTDEDFADAADLLEFHNDQVLLHSPLEIEGSLEVDTDIEAESISLNDNLEVSGTSTFGGTLTLSSTSKVNRRETGAFDLLPMAYGVIDENGDVVNATPNVSAVRNDDGEYVITISDATNFNTVTPVVIVTIKDNENIGFWGVEDNSKIKVSIMSNNRNIWGATTLQDSPFSFLIYGPN